MPMRRLFFLLICLALATLSWFMLNSRQGDVRRESLLVEGVPILKCYTSGRTPLPSVILLHDYGRSKESMRGLALLLARNGAAVLALDLRSHGDFGSPFDLEASVEDLGRALMHGLRQGDIDPRRFALVGVGIGADVIGKYAVLNPYVKTVVAISPRRISADDLQKVENYFLLRGGILHAKVGNEWEVRSHRLFSLIPFYVNFPIRREILDWLGGRLSLPKSDAAHFVGRELWVVLMYLAIFLSMFGAASLFSGLSWINEPVRRSARFRVGRFLGVSWVAGILAILVISLWLPFGFIRLDTSAYLVSYIGSVGILTLLFDRRNLRGLMQEVGYIWDRNGFRSPFIAILISAYVVGVMILASWGEMRLLPEGYRIAAWVESFLLLLPFFLVQERAMRRVQDDGIALYSAAYWVALRSALFLPLLCGAVIFKGSVRIGEDTIIFTTPERLIFAIPPLVVLFLIMEIYSHYIYGRACDSIVTTILKAAVLSWLMAALFPVVG
ncbi:MAG: dienelactone hydrolase family protein [bacterium]